MIQCDSFICTNFVTMDLIAQIRMGTSLCPGLCPWGHGGIGDVSALHYWYMRDGSDGFQKKADEQISVSEQENSQVRSFFDKSAPQSKNANVHFTSHIPTFLLP